MKTFKCEEMMCGNCVARIDKALDGEGIAHKTDLDTKTVSIEDDSVCCIGQDL